MNIRAILVLCLSFMLGTSSGLWTILKLISNLMTDTYMLCFTMVCPHFISPCERVWVTGPRVGGMWGFLPIVEPLRTKDYFDREYIWEL